MGASMRTRSAARLRAMSSESEVMRLTFTPGAGCSSKRVTAGPWAMPVRRVLDAEGAQRVAQKLRLFHVALVALAAVGGLSVGKQVDGRIGVGVLFLFLGAARPF